MQENLNDLRADKFSRRLRAVLALAVFLSSTVFFSLGLTHYEFDNMEAQDLDIAHRLYSEGRLDLPKDQSPVYYIIEHYLESLNENSLAFLRFPSAVFAGVAAMLIFLIMTMETNLVGGMIAAMLFSSAPYVIWFARLARTYSLMMMLAAACMYFAYLYLVKEKKIRYLAGFLVFAVLSFYTHYFSMIMVGALGILFFLDLLWHWRDVDAWIKALAAATVGLLAVYPQIDNIYQVIRATDARTKLFPGLAHQPMPFLKDIAKSFFLGVLKIKPLPNEYLIALAVLIVLGMFALKRRGILAGIVIFASALGIAWHLSATSPVSPRYLVFLMPIIACFMAAAPAKLKTVFVWAPVTAVILGFNMHYLRLQFPEPPTDWKDAAAFVEKNIRPGDVVAVFPGYWKPTFRRLYHHDDTVPFSQAESLERIRTMGKRVFVIKGTSRYFGNIEEYIKTHAAVESEFETKVRTKLRVDLLAPMPPVTADIENTGDPSLIVAGMVGSGGYPWQDEADPANPFERLGPVFRSADLVIAGYASYAPAKFNWKRNLFWRTGVPRREINSRVIDFLGKSGVGAVALLSPRRAPVDPAALFAQAGVRVIPYKSKWSTAEPTIFHLKNLDVAVLWANQNVYTDRPNHKASSDAVVADWENAVTRAKSAVGPNGRLVVLMPQRGDYDRLLDRSDQMIARRAVELGADAVVGMGGFAFKEVEEYRDGIIVYDVGTLLRPPFEHLNNLSSTGILARLTFPESGKVRYQVIPVTFDDDFRTALAPKEKIENIFYSDRRNLNRESLADRLLYAEVGCVNAAGKTLPIRKWVSDMHPDASVHEGYFQGAAGVGVAGVNSMGDFRRVLSLRPQENKKVSVTFPKVRLGNSLEVTFGVDDAFIHWKKKVDETLSVTSGSKKLFVKKVKNITGWHTEIFDTSQLAGNETDLTFALETIKKDTFPVAVDAVVIRTDEQVQALDALPYRFEDHLREARVAVEDKDGKAEFCDGPDEAFRHLYGGNKKRIEEDGLSGEGVLHTRFFCSALPWDGVARALQRSGGELRPVIWLHPLKDATRTLTYGPIPLRSEIEGFAGFTDLVVKKKVSPVHFVVLADGKEIYSETVAADAGWKPFKFDLPADLVGKTAEITFLVRTKNQTWDHFCFNAWMN